MSMADLKKGLGSMFLVRSSELHHFILLPDFLFMNYNLMPARRQGNIDTGIIGSFVGTQGD